MAPSPFACSILELIPFLNPSNASKCFLYSGILFISFSVNIIFLPSILPILPKCFQTSSFNALELCVITLAITASLLIIFPSVIAFVAISLSVSTITPFTIFSTLESESDIIISFTFSVVAVIAVPTIIFLGAFTTSEYFKSLEDSF